MRLWCGAHLGRRRDNETWRKVWAPHVQSAVDGRFSKSKAMKKLDPKIISEAFKTLSALATARWCRVHLLGGFARPKDNDAASNTACTKEREAAVKKSQKSKDSIAARALRLAGLPAKEEAEEEMTI